MRMRPRRPRLIPVRIPATAVRRALSPLMERPANATKNAETTRTTIAGGTWMLFLSTNRAIPSTRIIGSPTRASPMSPKKSPSTVMTVMAPNASQ